MLDLKLKIESDCPIKGVCWSFQRLKEALGSWKYQDIFMNLAFFSCHTLSIQCPDLDSIENLLPLPLVPPSHVAVPYSHLSPMGNRAFSHTFWSLGANLDLPTSCASDNPTYYA